MLSKSRLALIGAGLGLWAPAAYFFLARLEWTPPAAFASVLSGLLAAALASGAGVLEPVMLLAFAVADLVSVAYLLPSFGLHRTFLAGAPFFLGLLFPSRRDDGNTAAGPASALLLAAAAAVPLTRCVTLLIGHHLYGAAILLSALALGAGLGAIASRSAPQKNAGPGLFAAGLAGILCLEFFRFIGINTGGGEYLQAPLLTCWDIVFVAGQAYAASALWAFGLGFAGAGRPASLVYRIGTSRSITEDSGRKAPPLALWAAAVGGPAAGAALLRLLGPAKAFACFDLCLMLAGISAFGPLDLMKDRSLRGGVVAALLLALWSGWGNRDVFRDIWLYRLSLSIPGGDLIALREDGGESFGVYRSGSPGKTVLIVDGSAQFAWEQSDRHSAHLPLILRRNCARALFLGVRNLRVINSALAHTIELDAVDPNPAYPDMLKALRDPKAPEAPTGKLNPMVSPLRRYLAAPGPRYDTVFLELSAPLHSPANALRTTRESLKAAQGRLNPGGILAVRLPQPLLVDGAERVLRTLLETFPHGQICPMEGSLLILASDTPFETGHRGSLQEKDPDAWIDDFKLEEYLAGDPCRPLESSPGLARLLSETDDLTPSAFPLADMLRTGR